MSDELRLGESAHSRAEFGLSVSERFDLLGSRIDMLAARLDRWIDEVEMIKVTQAGQNDDLQALRSALEQMNTEVANGLAGVVQTMKNLQDEVDNLQGEGAANVQSATAAVVAQVNQLHSAFAPYLQSPVTPDPAPTDPPVDPQPLPEPTPSPEPASGDDVGPGPVSPSGDGSGDSSLNFP